LGETNREHNSDRIVLWLSLTVAIIVVLNVLYFAVHPEQQDPDGVASGLIIVSSMFMALVPSFMFGNVICWQLPPIRKANLAAMQEFTTVSYQSATTGLIKLGSVVIPVSLAVATLAVFAPWTK